MLGLPVVRGAPFYMSVVAETFGPDAAAFSTEPGKPVTYSAIDGGYINSGDPVGGETPAPASLVESAMAQAVAERGYQAAAPGTAPALLLVYNWGEIRHDSFQVQPTDHMKGNDRARLLLLSRTADAERIERDVVADRYTSLKVGAITRTERDRETLLLARDELAFVVVSAYDVAALREHNRKLVWQVKLTTRAVGRPMSDSLVSLIHYGARYFGHDEPLRKSLKETVVSATMTPMVPPPPAARGGPSGVDAAMVENIVQSEHEMWSGRFASGEQPVGLEQSR